MKLIFTTILIAFTLASCSKKSDVKPNSTADGGKTSSTIPGDSTTTGSKLTADDSLHMPGFGVSTQIVTTSVSGTNLFLKLNENVNLIMTAAGYNKTSGVHLLENFKNSSLAGFDFTTVAEGGNTTLNWVDDNLNNVILKTVTDTVINGQSMVKINVNRVFTFFKVYDSNQLAVAEQNTVLGISSDTIVFTNYCYYNQTNYPQSSVTAKVVYVK
jgi:hypothetical protein